MRTVEEYTSAGLAAVCSAAVARGLPTDDLRVLSARGNLLVHLAPAPVLARVCTLTARTRREPFAWMRREVAVAGWAAGRGGPVVAPWTDPGPHRVDGLVLSLWELAPTRPGQATGAELGAALAALHAATAGFPGALPHLAPANEQIAGAVDACERDGALPAGVITVLRDRHRRVLTDLAGAGSAPIVLHGDAHGGNLLRVPGGWCWTDLEETCAGPPEWDLAVMSGADDGPAALAAYAAATGTRVPTEGELGPFRRARELEATVWLVAMAHLFPGRYRAVAAQRLAALLAG